MKKSKKKSTVFPPDPGLALRVFLYTWILAYRFIWHVGDKIAIADQLIIIIVIINLTLWGTLQIVIQTQKCAPNQTNQLWKSVLSSVANIKTGDMWSKRFKPQNVGHHNWLRVFWSIRSSDIQNEKMSALEYSMILSGVPPYQYLSKSQMVCRRKQSGRYLWIGWLNKIDKN